MVICICRVPRVLILMHKCICEWDPDRKTMEKHTDAPVKNGNIKEVALLFEDMRVRFPPTIKHFTSLLYGWFKEGKLMEAKSVWVQMREAGFEPDIVVYNNLLNGHAVAGEMVDAFDLLKEMRKKGCDL
ncbi:hypothetical protein L2E82_12502 [Cichorium intybus]|uniref:Uncharacterized protein n=1 Tax=Cichorium intybus TaxID=13427 RepID=A0ACB9GHA0_CICIN|nr:hypothetical protein L2E82_12502 [Cichorium intybus]